jgi:DNA-binding protein YbaB
MAGTGQQVRAVPPVPHPDRMSLETQTQKLLADAHQLRKRLAGLERTVESPDGLIEATMSGDGTLTGLVLDPRIYRTTDSTALAAEILRIVNAAAAEVAAAAAAEAARTSPPELPAELAGYGERYENFLAELKRGTESEVS